MFLQPARKAYQKKWVKQLIFDLMVICICIFVLPASLLAQDNADSGADEQVVEDNVDKQATSDVSPSLKDSPFSPDKLIQPYNSASLGQLKLPAFWEVAEEEQVLRAIENDSKQPLSVQFFLIDRPFEITASEYIDHLFKMVDGLPIEQQKRQRKKVELSIDPPVSAETFCFSGIEQDILRRHCIGVLAAEKMLVVSISGPATRSEFITPDAIKALIVGMN